jgi:hypothetical protein
MHDGTSRQACRPCLLFPCSMVQCLCRTCAATAWRWQWWMVVLSTAWTVAAGLVSDRLCPLVPTLICLMCLKASQQLQTQGSRLTKSYSQFKKAGPLPGCHLPGLVLLILGWSWLSSAPKQPSATASHAVKPETTFKYGRLHLMPKSRSSYACAVVLHVSHTTAAADPG